MKRETRRGEERQTMMKDLPAALRLVGGANGHTDSTPGYSQLALNVMASARA